MKPLFLSSGSNNTKSWVLLQRKIRDQGSNFSQETAKLATGVLTTEEIGISFYCIISIPVASKENDRESDRPYFLAPIPSTAQTDQSDTATYYDE